MAMSEPETRVCLPESAQQGLSHGNATPLRLRGCAQGGQRGLDADEEAQKHQARDRLFRFQTYTGV